MRGISIALDISLAVVLWSIRLSRSLLHEGLGSEDEMRLVNFLFERQGYNPLIRPVQNLTEKVKVNFGLAMIQLINVDEKNQIMKSNVWLRMIWQDYQMKWDPKEFGGIEVIRVDVNKVWKPDMVLFNNADGRYEVSYKPNAVISSNGQILWIPPAIYKSSCTINVRFFPFDEQNCEMKFGSWTFDSSQMSLDWYEFVANVDLNDYVNSGSWDLMDCPAFITQETDHLTNTTTPLMVFKFRVRRKTLFYTVNLIIPCVLISFLSVCVFFLPADAGEKVTMCISILLALVVFLLLVSKILPPTSNNIPLIANYLLFTFLLNVLTIFMTVVVINWNFRTPRTHKMPQWVRIVFLNYLPRILLMKRPNHMERCAKKSYSSQSHMIASGMTGQFPSSRTDLLELSDVNPEPEGSPGSTNFQMTPEIYKATESVRFIAAHLKNEDDYEEILEDWRFIALVIDRLMLYIFLLVTVFGTIAIMVQTPFIFENVNQAKIILELKLKELRTKIDLMEQRGLDVAAQSDEMSGVKAKLAVM